MKQGLAHRRWIALSVTVPVLALTVFAQGCFSRDGFADAGDAHPSSVQEPAHFGFGRPATATEIASWDIDVMPDGTGLPPGSGTAVEGAAVYAAQCAVCHGSTGTEGPFNPLVGREPRDDFPFGRTVQYPMTVGNYWPYATTLYDYINRAMPWETPGSLNPDDVYGLVAYILYENDIVAKDLMLDAHTLPNIVMPARDRFVPDDRRGGPEIR